MTTISSANFVSPCGEISITINDNQLSQLSFLSRQSPPTPSQHSYSEYVISQLKSYFNNPLHRFSIDLNLVGTDFQQRVWRALQDIPSGTTLTYGMLAKQLKTSARAIGQACRTNPIPIIIPCHRIVAAGHLGGFMGSTTLSNSQHLVEPLSIKAWLLQHEGIKLAALQPPTNANCQSLS